MNITANFYTFAKRENSTKTPTGGANDIPVCFKEDTNILNPVLEINYANAFNFNYCYLAFTGRYYFVQSVDSIAHNTYAVQLECDVLASHISAVLGQNVYAVYSSAVYDELIDDGRVIPVQNITAARNNFGHLDVISSIPLMFLSLVTSNGYLGGADIFFNTADDSALTTFISDLSDISFWETIQQNTSGINAFDALNDLYFLPFFPQYCHEVEQSKSAQIYGKQITGKCIKKLNVIPHTKSLTLPQPSVSDFRFSQKYVKYFLHVPYIGVVNIPTELAAGNSTMDVDYCADCVSGELVIAPRIGGVSLGIYATNLKASIGIARQRINPSPFFTNIVGDISGGALSGGMLGGVSGAMLGAAAGVGLSAIRDVFNVPKIERAGSSGGSIAPLSLGFNSELSITMTVNASDIDPAILNDIAGRPCERIIPIQNGYIQARGASVSFAGMSEEIRQFNSLLNGGIYVE